MKVEYVFPFPENKKRYVVALIRISKSLLVVNFLRASGGIVSKKTLVESEETNSDYRASGNRVT